MGKGPEAAGRLFPAGARLRARCSPRRQGSRSLPPVAPLSAPGGPQDPEASRQPVVAGVAPELNRSRSGSPPGPQGSDSTLALPRICFGGLGESSRCLGLAAARGVWPKGRHGQRGLTIIAFGRPGRRPTSARWTPPAGGDEAARRPASGNARPLRVPSRPSAPPREPPCASGPSAFPRPAARSGGPRGGSSHRPPSRSGARFDFPAAVPGSTAHLFPAPSPLFGVTAVNPFARRRTSWLLPSFGDSD